MLRYTERPPSRPLGDHVRCLWALSGNGDAGVEVITPDGRVELVIHLGNPLERLASTGATSHGSAVVGPTLEHIAIRMPKTVRTVGVRFQFGGSRSFLQPPLEEMRDQSRPLEAFWPKVAPQLLDRLASTPSVERQLDALEEALLGALRPAPASPAVGACLSMIQRRRGNVRMSELAEATGLSLRSLQRAFRATVGISPKQFARIARFRFALRRLPVAGRSGWAGLAADLGYVDQSHLIHDFRQFTGMTPSAYAGTRHGFNDALLVSDA